MDKICCICSNNLPESHLSCSFCNEGKYCIDCYSKLKCNCSQCSEWNDLFSKEPSDSDGEAPFIPSVVFNCENNIKSCGICRNKFAFHKQHKFISEAFTLNRGATYKNINLLNKIRAPLIHMANKLVEDYDNTKDEDLQDDIFEQIQGIDWEILGNVYFSIDHKYLKYMDKPLSSWMGPNVFSTCSRKITFLLTKYVFCLPKPKVKIKKVTYEVGNKLKVTLRDVINFTDTWPFANTSFLWARNSIDHHFVEDISCVGKNTIEISTGS